MDNSKRGFQPRSSFQSPDSLVSHRTGTALPLLRAKAECSKWLDSFKSYCAQTISSSTERGITLNLIALAEREASINISSGPARVLINLAELPSSGEIRRLNIAEGLHLLVSEKQVLEYCQVENLRIISGVDPGPALSNSPLSKLPFREVQTFEVPDPVKTLASVTKLIENSQVVLSANLQAYTGAIVLAQSKHNPLDISDISAESLAALALDEMEPASIARLAYAAGMYDPNIGLPSIANNLASVLAKGAEAFNYELKAHYLPDEGRFVVFEDACQETTSQTGASTTDTPMTWPMSSLNWMQPVKSAPPSFGSPLPFKAPLKPVLS